MAGLNKEIWLPELMEGFYAEDNFLNEARDMSAFVENDKINLADAGVNPDVLVNNSTYPIGISERSDVPLALELDMYDTKNTLLRNAEAAELAYDKRSSVLYGHRQALKMKFLEKAAHQFAPSTNSANTPVLETTGSDNGLGFKSITFEDILTLEGKFDEAEIPSEGRVLVLSATHKAELRKADLKLYTSVFSSENTYGGFKIYTLASKRMPVYNKTTKTKVAYGAAAAPSTDTTCSFAFHKDEVMRAKGSLDMFERLKDPESRGDVIGFQMRGLAMPIRGIGCGAIVAVSA
jgi:hypothetical protein